MTRPPFRIEELRIQSFRGIDELCLKFPVSDEASGGLAILAGDNGRGKTAIIEAILLALGKLDLLPDDSARIEDQVRFGAEDFSIDALVRTRNGVITKLHADMEVVRCATHRGIIPMTAPFSESTLDAWSAIEAMKANVQYFSARREPEALGRTVGDPPTRGARSMREAARVAELKKRIVSTYFHAMRAGRGGVLPATSPFVRIQNFVRQFLGSDGILHVMPATNDPSSEWEVVFLRGEIPLDDTSIAKARIDATTNRNIPVIVPIDRMSSGQIALFAFAGPLVFRDAPADVVLIDEPEQHLHPQWQQHILPALMRLSPESQFIVATHSMDIADSAMSFERFLILPQGDPRLSRNEREVAAE